MKQHEIENLIECHKGILAARLSQCKDDYARFQETTIAYNFLCDRLLGKV